METYPGFSEHSISDRIIDIIQQIPYGKVASYSQIAKLAGLSNGARRVARILHSCTRKHGLPWHRVLKADGTIALPMDSGGTQQYELLCAEGIGFVSPTKVNLTKHLWDADSYLATY